MEKFICKINDDEIKYIQIANHIKSLINSGQIHDGERLPSIRALAASLKVNNVTIVNCYNRLKAEGYTYQKMGSGTFAKRKEFSHSFKNEYSKEVKKILNNTEDNIIDFTGESLKDTYFPIEEFKIVLNEVLEREGAKALLEQEPLGYNELRKTISSVFWKDKVEEDKILILSGAQQGIDIASKAILNINDNVIVEQPTYGGALSVFKWRRANIFEIPMNNDGIDINKFEDVLKKNKIKCFYAMSYFQNPTGISYSKEKKIKILELAEKYDFYIIEDDYLSELIYDECLKYELFKDLDKNDRVVYIRSFSKVFLPGIRLGYMIYPKIFRDTMQNSKINTDIATSALMQKSLEVYIKKGYYLNHINRLTLEYKNRYILMKKLIEETLGEDIKVMDPKGGLYFYLIIKNKDIDSKELFYKLKKRGVFITPGCVFYKENDRGLDTFRIAFSQTGEEYIKRGINEIKEAINTWHI